ncbi:N-acetylmuramidase domain-containing protein [Roseibium sp. M-1]
MLGTGRAQPLPPNAFSQLAAHLDVDPLELKAIAQVESSGQARFSDGRLKILFERHIFYSQLPEGKRAKAVAAGLAHQGARKSQYKDQKTSEARYSLLSRAIQIDRNAAFRSISSGEYQIMGFNAGICGYGSAEEMFSAFVDSDLEQLKAFANFLKANNLVTAIRNRDFARIARVYNGDKTGKYETKLRQAAEALRRSSAGGTNFVDVVGMLIGKIQKGARGEQVRMLQETLHRLGYPVGKVDGIFGSITQAALLEFQANNNLETSGIFDVATTNRLNQSTHRAATGKRREADEKDLEERGSQTIKLARRGRLAGIASTVLGAIGLLGNASGGYKSVGDGVNSVIAALPGNDTSSILDPLAKIAASVIGVGSGGMSIPMIAVGLFAYYSFSAIAKRRLEDHRLGLNRGR